MADLARDAFLSDRVRYVAFDNVESGGCDGRFSVLDLIIVPAYDTDSQRESPYVDKPEIQSEEGGAPDEKYQDERNFKPGN